ncbi:IF4E2-like protein [Mya arenaria]|uniref:IF4E2-like protein n=1 Tax=Mya arenaria TaxID=6604 RepID=A0ABY7G036_MYAAR|nr:IF4E2-like protein [Mya arenaria]
MKTESMYTVVKKMKPGPGENPLQYNYGFWYSRKSQGNKSASYDQNLKLIGTFASDNANKNGGKWIIRLKKGLASRCWENLILAMLGEQFMEDILSLWNRTASDGVTTSRIRDTLKRILNLPPNTIMEYKTHGDSLKSVILRLIVYLFFSGN